MPRANRLAAALTAALIAANALADPAGAQSAAAVPDERTPAAAAPDERTPAAAAPAAPARDDADGGETASATSRPGQDAPAEGAIPQLLFSAPAGWVKVEVIDNVTGGCFLAAGEAQGYAERQIRAAGQPISGDDEVFHVIFRVRATGDRMGDGRCFGAIFFEELYPIDVAVQPGAEPYRSRWPGRLGLQKLVIDEDAFDREVFQVIDDGVGILFRQR